MRVYISVPMRGRTDAEILNERRKAIEIVKADNPYEDIKVINNFFREESRNDNPLWCLGESLKSFQPLIWRFSVKGGRTREVAGLNLQVRLHMGLNL